MFDVDTVICRERPGGRGWLLFEEPRDVFQAADPAGVRPLLERAREAAGRGLWAAGWIAYEAAPAFDPAFRARPPRGGLPLAWMGIYDAPRRIEDLPPPDSAAPYRLGRWRAELDEERYTGAIARIRELIAAGDTYQVNFTHRHEAAFDGDPARLFLELTGHDHGGMAAYVRAGRHAIVSASPELFFSQDGERVLTRPMKGTAPRAGHEARDEARAGRLRASPKERAENVMIVDLLRNDLGRISRPGSVRVSDLFAIERYETVIQMTSTVTALTDRDPVETLGALFPCGSVTGAPKIRTMEIIAALEGRPRGVYTGSVGWIGPGRTACFNVAIRTVEIDVAGGRAVYGVGGGVTWDSDPRAEYEEMLAKTGVLRMGVR